MSNELLVNVTLGETRVARIENGSVAELYIERSNETNIVGNIYKGKVVRVLPGMQAAFVDVGLERTAFLHASDIIPDDIKMVGEIQEREADDVVYPEGEDSQQAEVVQAAALPEKKSRAIQDLLKEGKEILVQVTREPISTKGARLTSHISLPGRYVVFMPTVAHIGISRRIEDEKERKRLREIVERICPENCGVIVRTASEGVGLKELKADIAYLTRLWATITEKATKAPGLIHGDLDVVLRVVRDLFTDDIYKFIIDSEAEYERILEFVETFQPKLKKSVELYTAAEPIFDRYGVEVEITRALGQKVWLKSGGYIIIEQTEALTAIDVNTGRFVGRRNVEDTILKTNLEAVKEIVYQLRLRNIGGIIILDFIDMERHVNRAKVFNTLKEALRADRAKTTITKISELGLVEMTRKRTREDISRSLTDPCPYCEGKGYLKSTLTICYEIFREIRREAPNLKGKQIVVYVHASVADVLYDEERRSIEELEERFKKRIYIKAIDTYHLEQFDILEK